jgi:myosin heavy subunit
MVGVDDLVLLDNPSNEKIVDMLKTRYASDQIYVRLPLFGRDF